MLSSPLARVLLASFVAAPALGSTGCLVAEGWGIDDAVTIETVTQEESGEARFDIGEINENCSDEDPDDNVFYSQREDADGVKYCLIAMDWEKLLIDMAEIRDGVEENIQENTPDGVPQEGVKIEFTDVSVKGLNIRLVKESENGDEETLGFERVTYYLAHINLEEVGGLLQVDWPVPGDDSAPESPRVSLLGADGVGNAQEDEVIDYLNDAYEEEKDVNGQGHAELEFRYTNPEELQAMSGSVLAVNFTVEITGEGSYSVSEGLNPGENP